MRKMVKCGLLAILVVLLTLCLVSCGGLAGGDEDSGGSEGDVTVHPHNTSLEYICATSSGDTYTLTINKTTEGAGLGFKLTLIFDGDAPNITGQDYFDSVGLKGAERSLVRGGASTNHYDASYDLGNKENLIKYLLPSTKTWTIYFTSKENSGRNKSHKISAAYVKQIKAWLDEQ